MQFRTFDEEYLRQLTAGDARTQEHFARYFGALMKVKLRSRLSSPEAIEDVSQETFTRFYSALREGKLAHPERLAPFVNSICNNVLKESWRRDDPTVSLDDDDAPELPAAPFDLSKMIADNQARQKIQKVIEQLPERDRRALRAIFFEERDKDEVCRELGITRDNLGLLLRRARRKFRDLYSEQGKRMLDDPATA
jgi:RNA polymerase sigma-70 factor (ECF subfamily)